MRVVYFIYAEVAQGGEINLFFLLFEVWNHGSAVVGLKVANENQELVQRRLMVFDRFREVVY